MRRLREKLGARAALLAVAASLSVLALAPSGCAPVPNRDPVGEPFPQVRGQDLKEQDRDVPGEFAGKPVLILVGYVQETQFDLDRWLIGLLMSKTPVTLLELPTIDSRIASTFFAGTIDQGMRDGIPRQDWAGVVTVYGAEADKVVALTGNEKPRNARAILLDGDGVVRWFHDEGFSASVLLELDRLVRSMQEPPPASTE